MGWCFMMNKETNPKSTSILKKDDLEIVMSDEHASKPMIMYLRYCWRSAAIFGGIQSQDVRTVWSCLLNVRITLASLKRIYAWKQRLTAISTFPIKANAMMIMILIIYVFILKNSLLINQCRIFISSK